MDIQTVGKDSLVIYVSGNDLRIRHIAPESVTEHDTEGIINSALVEIGMPRSETVYLELFPGRDDLLMFVQLGLGSPQFFSFDDFESLLAAVSECCLSSRSSSVSQSSLIFQNGKYILVITPLLHETPPDCLSEFGEKLSCAPEYMLHLKEHGKTIISVDAIGVLSRAFCRFD